MRMREWVFWRPMPVRWISDELCTNQASGQSAERSSGSANDYHDTVVVQYHVLYLQSKTRILVQPFQ